MLKDFDMEVVLRQNFYDFFTERRHNTDDIHLLYRMKAFDPRRVSHRLALECEYCEFFGAGYVLSFPLPSLEVYHIIMHAFKGVYQ